MKDKFGTKLEIGDEVMFVGTDRYIPTGTICKVKGQRLDPRYLTVEVGTEDTRCNGEYVIKVRRPQHYLIGKIFQINEGNTILEKVTRYDAEDDTVQLISLFGNSRVSVSALKSDYIEVKEPFLPSIVTKSDKDSYLLHIRTFSLQGLIALYSVENTEIAAQLVKVRNYDDVKAL